MIYKKGEINDNSKINSTKFHSLGSLNNSLRLGMAQIYKREDEPMNNKHIEHLILDLFEKIGSGIIGDENDFKSNYEPEEIAALYHYFSSYLDGKKEPKQQ